MMYDGPFVDCGLWLIFLTEDVSGLGGIWKEKNNSIKQQDTFNIPYQQDNYFV